jgi:hypothetical protein
LTHDILAAHIDRDNARRRWRWPPCWPAPVSAMMRGTHTWHPSPGQWCC